MTVKPSLSTGLSSYHATGDKKSRGLARPLAPRIDRHSTSNHGNKRSHPLTDRSKVGKLEVAIKHLQNITPGRPRHIHREALTLLQGTRVHSFNHNSQYTLETNHLEHYDLIGLNVELSKLRGDVQGSHLGHWGWLGC